ncbi:MAG: hypothetical protein AAGG02_04815 [Cyanobacteria bacterium P01_H01_bin.15]
MRKSSPFLLTVLLAIAPTLVPAPVLSDEVRTETVQFPAGSSGTTIRSSVQGYDSVDYVLGAQAGQAMTVKLTTNHLSNYFNIYAPENIPGQDEAMYVGSSSGNRFDGRLPASGNYTVRVYLMRNAARRNEIANYQLDFAITGSSSSASPSGDDGDSAYRAGQGDFDATGTIPCAQYVGQPMNLCNFGVAREGNGTATVIVTKTDGVKRALFFTDGRATSADTSQADGYGEFSTEREGDLNFVRVGNERYEIPDAVIYGG